MLQFCGLAVIETKNRAMAIVQKLEQQLDIPKKVRIHWTGCPNSCGQVSSQFSILVVCVCVCLSFPHNTMHRLAWLSWVC